MNAIDPLISALISLCKNEGGEKFVADKAKVSAENLSQIIKGVKLPSGRARGVGPGLRGKITTAYPDWLNQQVPAPNNPLAPINKAQTAINSVVSLEQSLESLAHYLAGLDDTDRAEAMKMITGIADNPDRHAKIAAGIKGMVGAPFVQFQKTGTHNR